MHVLNPYIFDNRYKFLGLPLDFHIRTWEGMNVDGGGNFVSLTDLTGNGFDFAEFPYSGHTSPIEIVPSGINGLPSLKFDGTNNIYCNVNSVDPTKFNTSQGQIFHFAVFKFDASTSIAYISGCFNTYTSLGNRYVLVAQGGFFQAYVTPNQVTSGIARDFVNAHYAVQNTNLNTVLGGDSFFSYDNQTPITIATEAPAGYNNNFWTIGGSFVDRHAKMTFCEAGALVGNYNLITPTFLSDLAAYMTATYGI